MYVYIIIGLIVVLALLGILFITLFNRFRFAVIKLTEAENIIKKALMERVVLFDRIIPILKDNVKDEDDNKLLDSMIKLKNKKLNGVELSKELDKCNNKLNEVLDNNLELYKQENIDKLLKELLNNKEDIEYGTKYYNDNVVYYNKLVRGIPSNIIALLFRYKHRDFYENEKEEMFEILKK